MKHIFLIIVFFNISFAANSQIFSIPDTNFKNALISEGVDINNDGQITFSEAQAVTYLVVDDDSINDMTGIEAFVNLIALECRDNQITSLDLSKCTKLQHLKCGHNQLTSLDLNNNTFLTYIDCNRNKLTSLDVSNCSNLEDLNCNYNQLSGLNISKCSKLIRLHCGENKLNNINVLNNSALEHLTCFENQLTSLDLTNNLGIDILHCFDNKLSSLDLSNNINLQQLICGKNQLTELDLSNNTNLIRIECQLNLITNLSLTNHSDLYSLNCMNNPITNLNISDKTNLVRLFCRQNQFTNLDISSCISIDELDCSYNKLLHLDLTKNTRMRKLKCEFNPFTRLDISNNKALTYIDISYMKNLNEVCVWEKPFPPDGVKLKDFQSPNITYTTDCYSKVWVDSGATWHYDWNGLTGGGYTKIKYTKDTLINGKNCQKLVPQKFSFSTDFFGNIIFRNSKYLQPEFTTTSGDTVFYYNNGKFNILYNFGAQPGETWDLGVDTNNYTCSKSFVKVDSVGTMDINSQTYRWISLSALPNSSVVLRGKAIERFGSGKGYLFPTVTGCDLGIAYDFPYDNFTCYEDNSFPLYNVSNRDCEYWSKVAIDKLNSHGTITIYPNPTNGIILLITDIPQPHYVEIYTIHGLLVKKFDMKDGDEKIDLSHLSPGNYLLRLIHFDGTYLRKIIVI